MSLSKCSYPVMSRYHHYLSSPISWSKYEFSDPYWTRYHHEFERMRMSMMMQQDLIDEMMTQVRASRATHDSHISRCSAKCASITKSLKEDARSISTIESEINSWQSAVSDMHATMNSLRMRTKEMGATIERLRSDLNSCQSTIRTDFDIQSLMREMEEKRRRAELECTRIYSTLNISKPTLDSSWCPICKSNNCQFNTPTIQTKPLEIGIVKEPEREPIICVMPEPELVLEPIEIAVCELPSNVCPICGSDSCTYGMDTTPVSTACPICGAENCTYGEEEESTVVEETVSSNICSICGAEDCQYGKGTRCKVCNKLDCEYKRDDSTTKYLLVVDEDIQETTSNVCEICGSTNCSYSTETTTAATCSICFKENCPYFVSGSF